MTKDLWQGEVGPTQYICPWCEAISESFENYVLHAESVHPSSFHEVDMGTVEVVDIDLEKHTVTVRTKP